MIDDLSRVLHDQSCPHVPDYCNALSILRSYHTGDMHLHDPYRWNLPVNGSGNINRLECLFFSKMVVKK